MSINPVQPVVPPDWERPAEKSTRATSQPSAVGWAESAQPIIGTRPKPETEDSTRPTAYDEMPQDEVEVQHDDETDGKIVIKYVDHSGKLILQVPSSQILAMSRAIHQDFQQAARERETASPEENRGERSSHGH